MNIKRSSGILLHPSSLPGTYGIGDFGFEARKWIEFIVDAGFSWWQILPIGPTGFGHSPYQSFSSFAGNPLFISLDILLEKTWLDKSDLMNLPLFRDDIVEFDNVISYKNRLLTLAASRFLKGPGDKKNFLAYRQQQTEWLEDYALFIALKAKFGGLAWSEWPPEYRDRDPDTINLAIRELSDEIETQAIIQYFFSVQWNDLKKFSASKGLGIVGDLPIYVAHDSVDVWLHRHLFQLTDDGKLIEVAGVPPDYFTETGQLWGNPLYDWPVHAEDQFSWWQKRLAHGLKTFDLLRLDHFRGYAGYWSIPAQDKTAENGRWIKAPGQHFFSVMKKELPQLSIIAEDLGEITPDVINLRDEFDFPGMKVLQFAFFEDQAHEFLPHNYSENSVVYTGTHDHDTSRAWFDSADEHVKEFARSYLKSEDDEIVDSFVKAAINSLARLAVIPMQDLLNLDNSARMNKPGTLAGNWIWRLQSNQMNKKLAEKYRKINNQAKR